MLKLHLLKLNLIKLNLLKLNLLKLNLLKLILLKLNLLKLSFFKANFPKTKCVASLSHGFAGIIFGTIRICMGDVGLQSIQWETLAMSGIGSRIKLPGEAN